MTVYLTHHRSFCEELGRLHSLEVSWDGNGALPLKRKPLLAAMELFGRRPDLTLGSRMRLHRGGIEVSIFRAGRDVQVTFCKAGSVLISGHRPACAPDFLISSAVVTEGVLRKLRDAIPPDTGAPFLSRKAEGDVVLRVPFEDFKVLRLMKADRPGDNRLLIGRRSMVADVYAYQDAVELPDDIYADQPLTGQSGLRDLVTAYLRDRCGRYSPA